MRIMGWSLDVCSSVLLHWAAFLNGPCLRGPSIFRAFFRRRNRVIPISFQEDGGKMTGNGSDPEPASEDSRLVSLEERLDRAEAAEAKRSGVKAPASDANYRPGNRVLAELLGGMLTSAERRVGKGCVSKGRIRG